MAAEVARVQNEEVVRLMIANRFTEAEQRCEAALDRPRTALFHAQIAFARVVLNNTPAVIEEALARAWKAEKLAADALANSSTGYLSSWMGALGLSDAPAQTEAQANEQLDLELVQADCYLLGSMAQLLLGSYVKGCYNLRAAWTAYVKARDAAEAPGTSPELKCLVKFGIGFFNLVVSMLPSSYLNMAEFVGFSGNRSLALSLLHEAKATETYWSPAAAALLLYYKLQIVPNLGLCFEANLVTAAEQLLASKALAPFTEESAFVLWMRGGLQRCSRHPESALPLYDRAAALATELPPLVEMVRYDQVWAALLARNFAAGAAAVEALLAIDPRSPVYHLLKLLLCGVQGDAAGVTAMLAAMDALRTSAPELFKPKSTGQFAGNTVDAMVATAGGPVAAQPARFFDLFLLELLVLWDYSKMLPEATAAALLAEVNATPVTPTTAARRHFVAGGLQVAAGATEAARASFAQVLALPRDGSSPAHSFPFAAYHLLCITPALSVDEHSREWTGTRFDLKDLFHIKLSFLRQPALDVVDGE